MAHVPAVRANAWEDISDLCFAYGLALDPWQENFLRGAMGERSNGMWATPRVGLSVPRQNGKGALIEARELAGLLLFGEELIIHSAHEYKTAVDGFRRVRSYFENYDDLRKKVKRISTSTAREFIELQDGRSLRFMARSKSSGRGFSADCLILDEAQELSEDTWAAILPTTSARPNPQIWLTGTPPSEAMNGEVFTRFHDSGHAGRDSRLCWMEWSASDKCDVNDREEWARANPQLGNRITLQTIADECEAMDPETFARERLGVWNSDAIGTVISADVWASLTDSGSEPSGRVAFGVDVSPDRRRASIAAAGFREDGKTHVELVQVGEGTGWIVPRLVELSKHRYLTIAVDNAGPAASLIPELVAARLRVFKCGAGDVKQACGALYDAVSQGEVVHLDDGILADAVASGTKRPLGDAWAWDRRSPSSDITPLVAVTLAAHGLSVKRKRSDEGTKAVIL